MKPLPCKTLHCELLARLQKSYEPKDLTYSLSQIQELGSRIVMMFEKEAVPVPDALYALEYVKATVCEFFMREVKP